MLKHTFCHIPKISLKGETKLWQDGIGHWQDIDSPQTRHLSLIMKEKLTHYINVSIEEYQNNRLPYFFSLIPKAQHWRAFRDFRHSVAYVDIETSGLYSDQAYITTISLYDGNQIKTYVRGDNLQDFTKDIFHYQLIVTYNGKCFDIPFIENYFRIKVDIPHIDLRYVLHNLGFKGGLKGCEKQLGIDREELEGVDGYFAVLLWQDYIATHNAKALDTLLAYNIADVVNLEKLMITAYNLNLKQTPFYDDLKIPEPTPPHSPYQADMETIIKIKTKHYL